MAYITLEEWLGEPRKVAGGKIGAMCLHGARIGELSWQSWLEFFRRINGLEKLWETQLIELTKQWKDSRQGYFEPDQEAVDNVLKRLHSIAGNLTSLVEDLESNSKATEKNSFFLSYSHQDGDVADKLAQLLRGRGFEVWRDLEKIRIGESIRQRIEAGIKESTFIIVLLSLASINSAWVNDEIDMTLALEKKYQRVLLLPIVCDDCEPPPIIQGRLWARFSDIAVDVDKFLSRLPTDGNRSQKLTIW